MKRRRKAILVSFGSVAQSVLMPPDLKRAFLHAFHQFPDVTFVWKYENDEDRIAQGQDNVTKCKLSTPSKDNLWILNVVCTASIHFCAAFMRSWQFFPLNCHHLDYTLQINSGL
ncbi:unnamed protein product [Gongylonema pulchrum]|uniref:glucuronosyltransferase n=1 Tax=Gongylonema pulchrum TaxID=637853 RepID=A0A183DG44_9BILA|nr:unnamed protein product [Gongylonema pulchrum]